LISKPLVGIVSRLVEQKGFDLLMRIPHEFAAEAFGLAVLGSGEQRFEDFFRWFAAAYPKGVAVRIGYDSALARRITAGADLFLMPSRYEPCGLNQMYAMRYGTLPIVHATGGLEDTVDSDTGFKFAAFTSQALLDALRTAGATYGSPHWNQMIQAAMQRDFSWDAAASRYVRVYSSLTS
jgi:starch synthase